MLEKHFDKTAQAFIESLCKALPEADPADVTRSFIMMLNLMLSTVSQHERIDQLSGGALKARDMKAAYGPMLKFVVAGFISAAR